VATIANAPVTLSHFEQSPRAIARNGREEIASFGPGSLPVVIPPGRAQWKSISFMMDFFNQLGNLDSTGAISKLTHLIMISPIHSFHKSEVLAALSLFQCESTGTKAGFHLTTLTTLP